MELELAGGKVVELDYSRAFREGLRPWAYTASIIPMALASVLAWHSGHFTAGDSLLLLFGGLAVHSGVNLFNYCYDPRTTNRMATDSGLNSVWWQVYLTGWGFYLLALSIGLYFALDSGWPVLLIGAVGLAGGYYYSAPPICYQDKGLAFPCVFLLMGPLMVLGGYYALTGTGSWEVVLVSLPVGFLVALILVSDEMRDVESDRANGVRTFTVRHGYGAATKIYYFLVAAAYLSTLVLTAYQILPGTGLLVLLSLPLAWQAVRFIPAEEKERAKLTSSTATLHLTFGALLILGFLV